MSTNGYHDSADDVDGEVLIISSINNGIFTVNLQLSSNSTEATRLAFHSFILLATVDARMIIQDMKLERALAQRRQKK